MCIVVNYTTHEKKKKELYFCVYAKAYDDESHAFLLSFSVVVVISEKSTTISAVDCRFGCAVDCRRHETEPERKCGKNARRANECEWHRTASQVMRLRCRRSINDYIDKNDLFSFFLLLFSVQFYFYFLVARILFSFVDADNFSLCTGFWLYIADMTKSGKEMVKFCVWFDGRRFFMPPHSKCSSSPSFFFFFCSRRHSFHLRFSDDFFVVSTRIVSVFRIKFSSFFALHSFSAGCSLATVSFISARHSKT